MKAVTISIYKGKTLIAKKKITTMRQEVSFLKANYPAMKLWKVKKEGWKVLRSY